MFNAAEGAVSWSEAINAGSTRIKAIHINEIRARIEALEAASSGSTPWEAGSSGAVYYNGGNVGIGRTSPSDKLVVSSPGSADVKVRIDANGDNYAGLVIENSLTEWLWQVTPSSDAPASRLRLWNGGEIMTVIPNGNVGIGTSSPRAKLDVNGPILSKQDSTGGILGSLSLAGKNTTATAPYDRQWTFYNMADYSSYNGLSIWEYYDHNNNGTYCDPGGICDSRFHIQSGTGNVGIGTSSPGYKLDVVGNGRFHGWLRVDNGNLSGDEVQFETQNGFHRIAFHELRFYDWGGGGDNMTINNGRVGIGTSSPSQKLDVAGGARILGNLNVGSNVYLKGTETQHWLSSYSDGTFYIGAGRDSSGNRNNISLYNLSCAGGTCNVPRIYLYADTTVMTGNVGIGTSSPSHKLHVNGDARVNGWLRTYGNTGWYSQTHGGGWYMIDSTWLRAYGNKNIYTGGNVRANAFLYSSDKNLKKNIKTLDGLSLVQGLRGVSFDWKEDGSAAIGFVAQEVETVLPELVATDEATGLKSVQYGNITAALVEAVKTQQNEIKKLKGELQLLKALK